MEKKYNNEVTKSRIDEIRKNFQAENNKLLMHTLESIRPLNEEEILNSIISHLNDVNDYLTKSVFIFYNLT